MFIHYQAKPWGKIEEVMKVDWAKDVEMLGISGDDVVFEVYEVSEEDGYAAVNMSYAGNTKHTVNADFYDTVCVDYFTGKPLNYFLDPDIFTVVNR